MNVFAVAVFIVSYLLIAAPKLARFPLGRAGAALLGAFLMVAGGVLSPAQSFAALSYDTLLLLFAMMLFCALFERAGLFKRAAAFLLRRASSPLSLLIWLSCLAGGLSALLVNDTVCVFFTPVVVALCAEAGLPFAPYLLALATSANLGSAATLVGNPQNMLIGATSHLPFGEFFLYSGLAAFVALALNTALLWLFFRRKLRLAWPARVVAPRVPLSFDERLALLGLAGSVAAFFLGAHLGYAALGGVLFVLLLGRLDPLPLLARVDYSLLVFFAGLFVIVAGLNQTGLLTRAFAAAEPYLQTDSALGLLGFTAFFTLGSNLVSNVPLVLLALPSIPTLGDATAGYVLLAFVSTVAGNLTLIGSVANLIVVEGARRHYRLGFREYLLFGLPSTLLSLAVGVGLLALILR